MTKLIASMLLLAAVGCASQAHPNAATILPKLPAECATDVQFSPGPRPHWCDDPDIARARDQALQYYAFTGIKPDNL